VQADASSRPRRRSGGLRLDDRPAANDHPRRRCGAGGASRANGWPCS